MRIMGIRMEVKLTDGYQQRFTSACLAQIGNRKGVTKIEDDTEGWKDHDDRRLQQVTAGQAFQNRETATGHRNLQTAIG